MNTTQIDYARDGVLTPEMQHVAETEHIDENTILSDVANGRLVIMTGTNSLPVAIGKGATTKINVNLGTSSADVNPESEIEKVTVAEKYGADTITDLSMGGDISGIRKRVFENTSLPVTTVPIYQSIVEYGMENVNADDILLTLKNHIDEGVSSVVLHFVNSHTLEKLKGSKRVMGMVSKGGSFTSVFMLTNWCENPFIQYFDEILEMLRKNDVVLSLGNTMRSGCIHDLSDDAQKAEIETNVNFANRANEKGVQVIVEGVGGHVQANDISDSIRFYKSRSKYPLFVAGPLPTEVGLGYDHIAGSVGASMASGAGADYLCYITPSEHLALPTPEQVREGVVAFKIAGHIGDSIKYGMSDRDLMLSMKRRNFDWNGQIKMSIDPDKPGEMCPMEGPCTMCGEYCAIKIMQNYLSGDN